MTKFTLLKKINYNDALLYYYNEIPETHGAFYAWDL